MINLDFLPKLPGIYIFKDKAGNIIYIGKAKSIRKRVSSYFQNSHLDSKVSALLQEYCTIEHIVTYSETEALLLEAQLVGAHKPKFNILLKEGQPFLYIVFTSGKMGLPKMVLSRNKDIKGHLFGPFLHKMQARKMYEYLLGAFRLSICNKTVENGCLDYHLGLCAGNCKSDFDKEGYLFRLGMAQNALKKDHEKIKSDLFEKILHYNKNLEFEKSKYLQEYVENIDIILHTIATKFSEEKYKDQIFEKTTEVGSIYKRNQDIDKKIQLFLRLNLPVKSIDCFDISHFQGSFIVGSCIRFINGVPEKNKFRKFKIKTLENQNDYAALQEIVSRRYREGDLPDLILIDGGKGQLNSIVQLDAIKDTPCISLAKKEETIFSNMFSDGIKLDLSSDVGLLFVALRDYAHHFAISYHRKRKIKGFIE